MVCNKKKPDKVLLVYPQIVYFPVNFAYIFPCLKRHDIVYDFVDLNTDPDFFEHNDLDEYYAVATGGLIGHFFMMADLFNKIRELKPDLPRILGGRVTGAPEYFLKEFPAEYFVFGEADPAMPNLLKAIYDNAPLAEVKGIAYRDAAGNYICNQPEKKHSLEEFNPDWDEVDMEYYLSNDEFATGGYYSDRSYPIIIGMGCIGQCVFCNPVIKGFRIRPPVNVVAELVEAKRKYNITSFFIDSEIFYLKLKDVEEFCDLLKENRIDLPFAASIRADTNPEIIRPLAEAGCKTLMIGIEAYDNAALKAMNKHITTDDIDRVVQEARKNRINLIGGFLVGNPGDTEDSIVKTADYIVANDIVCPIRPMGLMIYPSTTNYVTAKEKNFISDEWAYFRKFCNYSYAIRITENGIGEEFPNITGLSNAQLWHAYARASFRLYNHFMSNKVLKEAQLDTQTAACCNCGHRMPIKKPVWMQICPECGYTNYCDIHMMGLMSEKSELLAEFCCRNTSIAIAGTYHFKMALLKLCLETGLQSSDLLVVEDNEQRESFFQSLSVDLRIIRTEEIAQAEAVVYAGLFLPAMMEQRLREKNFSPDKMMNATPKAFKSLHKNNLYNISYYFEFTDNADLQAYGNRVAQYLSEKYNQDICWVLYSNCPLGAEITAGILQSKLLNAVVFSNIMSVREKLINTAGEIKCLITTPRMTGYTEITNELSRAFAIPANSVLGLKKDICPELWSGTFINE